MATETWLWLASGLGYGAVNSGELLEAYPEGAEAIHNDLGSERLDEILTQKQAERLASTRPADFALPLAHAESKGIAALPFSDRQYPDMLRSISNPPTILFVKGDLSLLNGQLAVGMVGARRPSAYGVECVKALGRGVALGGAIIVSGLAAGLDAEAHKAALAVNGPTVACIAFGHDNCYPASNRTLMEVIERYGAVISEYPLGTKPEKPYFLHRNRLIAGLSHALVVTEARRHSGTMSTANFASEYGRDVFAVPGSIFSELSGGTNAMIRDGAYVAGSAGDILSLYGIELPGEDPVVAATKQAAEGRPLPASSTPPWREEVQRPAARRSTGELTLGEALQGELRPDASGRVSRGQAMDAFRKLQQDLPGDAAEEEARSRALDEMASAVNDSVELERRRSTENEKRRDRLYGQAEPKKEKVKPFQWDAVEHLSRAEAKRASAQREARPQTAPPQGAPARPAQPTVPVQAQAAPPAAPVPPAPVYTTPTPQEEPPWPSERPSTPQTGSVEPVGRVGRVDRVDRIERIERAERVQPARRAASAAPAAPRPAVVPAASAPPAATPAPAAPAVEPQATVTTSVAKPAKPAAEPVPARPAEETKTPSLSELLGTVVASGSGRKSSGGSLSGKLRTMDKEPPAKAGARRDTVSARPPADAPYSRPPHSRPAELPKREPRPSEAPQETPAAGGDSVFDLPARLARQSSARPPLTSQPPAGPPPDPADFVAAPAQDMATTAPPAPATREAPQPADAAPKAQAAPAEALDDDEPGEELLDSLSEAAQRAHDQLGAQPMGLSEICEKSGLASGEAMAALTELELAGLSRQLAGRQFIIMQ